MLSINGRVMTGAAGCHDEVIYLLKALRLLLEATETDHRLIGHEPRSVVEGLLHAGRLVKHLHCVVMVDTWRKLDSDFLLGHGLEMGRLDAICQGELEYLLVADIVIALRVVLEHCSVRCDDLEVMRVRLLLLVFLSSRWLIVRYLALELKLGTFCSSKRVRDSDDHRARVFEDVHVIGFENRNEHKRVGTFELFCRFRDGFEQAKSLVKLVADEQGYNLGVGARDRYDVVLLFQLYLKLVVVPYDAIVHDGDSSTMIEVWMSIDVRLVTMCGPSSVPDSHVVIVLCGTLNRHALDAVTTESVRASKLSADPLGLILLVLGNRNNAAGIVAATFQNLQALDADWSCLRPISKVAHNTAAFVRLLSPGHFQMLVQK